MAKVVCRAFVVCLLAMVLIACAGDVSSGEMDGATASGDDACEQYAIVGQDVGCSKKPSCSKITADCQAPMKAWVECVATDLNQCLCEPDGDLNCEGSYKDNEGPALCVAEFEAMNTCLEK